MSQKALFERLGAPLANVRRSWGAVRASDGVVFLRVWEDQSKTIDGKSFMRLTANEHFKENDRTDFGYQERLNHVALIRGGAVSYMIVCVVEDVNAIPRKIKKFNSNEVFPGGQLVDADGDTWLELGNRIRVQAAQP